MNLVWWALVGAVVGNLIANFALHRHRQRMLTRLRHPTLGALATEAAVGTLAINGQVAARFVPVAIPPGGGAEFNFFAVEGNDGTTYLHTIEANTMTGPPEPLDEPPNDYPPWL